MNMLSVDKNEDGLVVIELNGEIDATAMEVVLNQLVEIASDMQGIKMLYRITNFEWPSLSALGVEFKKLPQLLRLIARTDRIAVLTDEAWIATISEVEGALIPGVEIKAFELQEEPAALAYLNS